MPKTDLERASALMAEALTLCDAGGASLAAARLQLAIDTLAVPERDHRLREQGRSWKDSE